jgi:hypothetical protein
MPTLAQLREIVPGSENMSDAQLIQNVAETANLDPVTVAQKFGFNHSDSGITGQQFSSSLDRYQAGLYGVGEAAANAAGATGVGGWLSEQRKENELRADVSAAKAKSLGAVDEWKDVHGLKDFGSYAKGLAVQSAPYAAEALAGGMLARGAMGGTRAALAAAEASNDVKGIADAKRALDIGSTLGGTAASYPSSVGDILGNQREQNGQTNLGAAAALGVPYAALNALGETGMLTRGHLPRNPISMLDNVNGLKGMAARTAAAGGKTALEESLGETGQEVVNQLGRMAVDPNATLTDPQALERYKESAIGGATLGGLMGGGLGGWRRSGSILPDATPGTPAPDQPVSTNDIAQAFNANTDTTPDAIITGLLGRAADPLAGRSTLVGQGASDQTQIPAVAGGTTDVAVQAQQAQAEQQQVQQAQQQQVAREQTFERLGATYNPQGNGELNIFGQAVLGHQQINQFGNLVAAQISQLPAQAHAITDAIVQANQETGGKLVSFKYNGQPISGAKALMNAFAKVATKFQIGHVASPEEAAANLEKLSTTVSGTQLEQLNAIYQALTGKDTSGYIAEQQSKAAKEGAKNGTKQNNAGIREVPVQGGTTETGGAGAGSVRPAEVQPVGAGSVGAGSLGLQVGQPTTSGVRTGTSPSGNSAVSESGGTGQGTGQVNEQATQNGVGGGQVSGQPEQASQANVDQQTVRNGPRVYPVPPQYYATDLSHIQSERRAEILNQLFTTALRPLQERSNTVSAEVRAEIMRLALNEQYSRDDIAELTGLNVKTVEKQLERMHIKLVKVNSEHSEYQVTDPAIAVAVANAAQDFRSPEFPDGLGEAELTALYLSRYEGEETGTHALADELQQEGKPEAKLAEEIHGKENGAAKSMGIVEKGGSQGAVEALATSTFDRVEKLQAQLDTLPEKDPRRAKLAKDIEAQWAAYAKRQTKWATTGEIEVTPTEEGETNAVQEQSANEGNVRKPARGGKKVGEGNAKREKPARKTEQAKTEVNANEAAPEVKTPEEQWAALAKEFPPMGKYADLSTETKTKWDDLAHRGVANLAAATKLLENPLASQSTPFESLLEFDDLASHVGGLDLVREQFGEAGIGDAVDLVSDWELTNDKSEGAAHGSLRVVQGRYVGMLNIAKLTNAGYAAETARHELAHAIDMAPHGGIYSAQPEMGVAVVNGTITPEGPVAKELFNLYKTDEQWGKFLAYPFDTAKHADLNNRTKVQVELFAQAFSVYTTPEGRARMEKEAPVTAAYFKEVIQDVKSAKPLQIQKAETAARRAAVLHTRRESKGNRGPSKFLSFDQRVDELVLNSKSQQFEASKPVGPFSKAGSVLDELLTRPKEALHKLKLGFLTLEQLAELDKSEAQVVRKYADVSTAMQMMSKRSVEKAAQIDQLWAKLDASTSKALSNVMRAATRIGFDPDVEDAKTLPQSKVTPELLALVNDYEKLPNAAKNVYRRVRDHYAANYEERKSIMEEVGAKLGGKALEEIKAMYSKVKGPYFPLGRTGKYYAVGMSARVAELMDKREAGELDRKEAAELAKLRRNPTQYRTSSFSTLAEAKKAAEQFKNQLGYGYHNEVKERLSNAAASLPNFAKIEEYVNSQLGTDVRDEVRNMLTQMMFDMQPEHSALKRQMKREGIYGENEDMRQVFAQTAISQAHYISRLKFGEVLNQAMAAVGRVARRDIEMRQIENELTMRTKISMDNTQSALIDSLVNASYFAHLGLSPAFLLTNLTQVPMITAPWLGARHGFGATKRAMAAAVADTAKIIKTTYEGGDWRSELNWNSMFADGSNEDRMFRELLDRNVLDITMEHDLAAVASANRGFFDDKIASASKGKLQGMSDVVRLVNTPVRITELANRAVTALSAYRLKMEALASADMTPEAKHTAAVNYAARAVSETQLNYSELNAPRHMRQLFGSKPLAKMVFQFRKYQQGMMYLVAKNIADALPNSKASAEDKRIARRTIAGLYATTGLLAGTTGMPLMGTVGVAGIANLIAAAFGEPDEPWDFETEYRNFLTDWLGHDMALLVAKGLPAALGADVSKRVGMADIANPIPFVQRGNTGSSTVANTIYAGLGAPAGMIGTMYDGLVDLANGNGLKGIEKLVPVKELKDALRTYRYSTEGLTDKRGNVVLPPEKFDAWDLSLRGMGFTPTIESEYYAANAAMQNAKQAATDVRNGLLARYAQAKVAGEDTSEISQKVSEFNDRHPEQGVRITMSNLLQATQARRKMGAERTSAGLRVGKAQKPFAGEARFAETE